jgi:hypothetical protein
VYRKLGGPGYCLFLSDLSHFLCEALRLTLAENGTLSVKTVNWAALLGIGSRFPPSHWQDQPQDVEREKEQKPMADWDFVGH